MPLDLGVAHFYVDVITYQCLNRNAGLANLC